MVRGMVIFTRSFNPHDILGLIHRRRVSVLVCVPKILGVLREHVVRAFPEAADLLPQASRSRVAGGNTGVFIERLA